MPDQASTTNEEVVEHDDSAHINKNIAEAAPQSLALSSPSS